MAREHDPQTRRGCPVAVRPRGRGRLILSVSLALQQRYDQNKQPMSYTNHSLHQWANGTIFLVQIRRCLTF